MWVALALVALIGSQQRVIPFDVWVDVESWRIVVIVQPHDKRTVKAIALQPLAAKKGAPAPEPEAPHTYVTVPPNTFDLFGAIRKPVPTGNGLRATFTPPPENIAFDILVTFNDGTTHRSPRPHWNTVPGVIQTYRARDNRPMPPLEKPREIFPFRDRP